MAYCINGININALAETAVTSDWLDAAGFCTSNYRYNGYIQQDYFGRKMIKYFGGYIYSNECEIGNKYLKDGNKFCSIAAKGCRPCPAYSKRRWSSTTAGTYYINKFADGEVWISTTVNSRTGARISTAEENIQYFFTMLIGAGGGGGGGSDFYSGGGGAGGAFAFFCHKVFAGRTYKIVVGAGGSGGTTNINGSSGGNSEASLTTDTTTRSVSAGGGSGGDKGSTNGLAGSGNRVSSSANNSDFYRLDERNGVSGGNRANSGNSTVGYDTQIYTPEGHQLNYGLGVGGSGKSGTGGGGGAGWFFGHNGGDGSATAGGNGATGAGGGGGGWQLLGGHNGGNGGNGYAALFY